MMFFGFILGLLCGLVFGFFFCHCMTADIMQKVNQSVEDMESTRQKQDPSNWWKYGGEPFQPDQEDDDLEIA